MWNVISISESVGGRLVAEMIPVSLGALWESDT